MAGEGLKLFEPNYSQAQLRAERAEDRKQGIPVRHYYLKSRRVGITTDCSADTYAQTFGNDNYNSLIIAHDKERASEILQMSHKFQEEMPESIKQKLARSATNKLKFARTNSQMTIMTARSVLAGRGGTLHDLDISEYAHCEAPVILLKEIEQSLAYHWSTQGTLETTAFLAGSPAHTIWKAGKKNKRGQKPKGEHWWRSIFLCWMDDPAMCVLFRNERDMAEQLEQVFWEYPELKDRMLNYKMSPGQICQYAHFVKKCKGDLLFTQQEYPCDDDEAWVASGSPIFSLSLIGKYQAACEQGWMLEPRIDGRYQMFKSLDKLSPLDSESEDAPYLEVWEKPVPGRKYLISADCADGYMTSDYSDAMVFDIKTMEQVAEFHGHIDASEFAVFLIALGYTYNSAIVANEVNGIGQVVLVKLRDSYHNTYVRRRDTAAGVKMDGKLGWNTDQNTRPLMIGNAKRLFREMATINKNLKIIRSTALCAELRTFVTGKNGRPEAAHGCFDDRVITWCIGLTACMYETYGKLCSDDEPPPDGLVTGEESHQSPKMSDVMDSLMDDLPSGWAHITDYDEVLYD
jgi:hypothetical protein